MLDWLSAMPGAIAQGLIWGIMAIGVYITYKILDIADLTVDGSIVTGMAVCAVMITNGYNVWLALLCATLAGMLAGIVTGIFHTVMGIPAILAGILTQLMLWSANLKIMGKANIGIPARNFELLVSNLEQPKSIAIVGAFIAVIIGLLYWFFGTSFGMSVRATGCNQHMSRAQGINVQLRKLFGLALSNGIVALSGALLCQYNGMADIKGGTGAIVIGLAAVIIGDAIVSKISSNFIVRLLGVVVGGILYFAVYQTVIFLGLDTDLLKMLSAVVVAVFLAAPYLKSKYLPKKKKKNVAGGDKNA